MLKPPMNNTPDMPIAEKKEQVLPHEAMAMVLDGVDFSEGALFFNKYGYRNGKEPLFQYGNHYFSK